MDIQYQSVVATLEGELRVEGITIKLPQFDVPNLLNLTAEAG